MLCFITVPREYHRFPIGGIPHLVQFMGEKSKAKNMVKVHSLTKYFGKTSFFNKIFPYLNKH